MDKRDKFQKIFAAIFLTDRVGRLGRSVRKFVPKRI
jgi:hypothetical protein